MESNKKTMGKKILFSLIMCLLSLDIMAQSKLADKIDSNIYNNTWTLIRMNSRKIKYEPNAEKITLMITPENEYATGCSGCNTYVCRAIIKRNRIMFSGIGVTRMVCPDDDLANERIFLKNLADIDSYAIIDEDLYLYKNERPVLIFSKY